MAEKNGWVDSNGRRISNMDVVSACREGSAALFALAERSEGRVMKGEFQRYASILQVVGQKFKIIAELVEAQKEKK